MKYAPIGPIWLYNYLRRVGALADYHFVLAHHVLEMKFAHELFYNAYAKEEKPFVIMDNSLIELGEALSVEELMVAASICKADAVVLPDVPKDSDKTIELGLVSAEYLHDWMAANDPSPPAFKWMLAVQGKTVAECWECAAAMWKICPNLGYFGIPRHLVQQLGTRREITKLIGDAFPETPIHLLGFSDDINDDIQSSQHPSVMGIDSAAPCWIGAHGVALNGPSDIPKAGKRPNTFFTQDFRPDTVRLITRNIELVREWFKRS